MGEAEPEAKAGLLERMLGFIERVGNKVPHPAVLFLGLCVGLILLSQVLAWAGWSATYEVVKPPAEVAQELDIGGSMLPAEVVPGEQADADSYEVVTETAEIKGLLSTDGIRFLFTSFVQNFMAFTAMGIILIVMIGVGVSEASGLIASLIRKLVAASSPGALTYIIVGLGVVSSIASDAGYLVLIPLGAAAFLSVGRHPLAGMAAAFAGVAGGFGVNLLITPTDAVLTEITNEAIGLVEAGRTIDITANLYFGIGSTIVITVLLAIVSKRVVEPRLGAYDAALAPTGDELRDQPDTFDGITPEQDSRGLRWAGIAFVVALGIILALSVPSGAPLRDPETGSLIGTSPFMDGLIPIIAMLFLAAGLGYGRGARTLTTTTDAIDAVTKSWAGMAGLLFLFLLIAQFIAYFNYSNVPKVAAVKLGDLIEDWSIGTLGLLLVAIVITVIVGIIMPQAIAKWALLAPIFIPLFLRLGIDPEVVLAAYRVADSPINIVTPIMAYFPLIVVFALRYDKSAGIGTVIALMLPYFAALTVVWTAFFAGWYLLGIPWGP
ncbi:MAG: AbgT family transporter [Acidimicrobiales bacterium]|nr:AbgT family transporter [Acidimicrobiales bacterium]HRW37551.1 AbgT family transporter [Aquihabitans sp.]